MNVEEMASHEVYLLLCRMETAGLTGTDEYRVVREKYSEVMRREQAEIWGAPASPSSDLAKEETT